MAVLRINYDSLLLLWLEHSPISHYAFMSSKWYWKNHTRYQITQGVAYVTWLVLHLTDSLCASLRRCSLFSALPFQKHHLITSASSTHCLPHGLFFLSLQLLLQLNPPPWGFRSCMLFLPLLCFSGRGDFQISPCCYRLQCGRHILTLHYTLLGTLALPGNFPVILIIGSIINSLQFPGNHFIQFPVDCLHLTPTCTMSNQLLWLIFIRDMNTLLPLFCPSYAILVSALLLADITVYTNNLY